jgi:integrase
MALTWTRTGELRYMEWDEIEGLGQDDALWRVPAARMKGGSEHLVPLSRQALALLRQLWARRREGCKYVFPGAYRIDRPMSENSVLYLMYRMGYKGDMTGHGWRSVASTWANERTKFDADAIERQLSHTPADVIRGIYNRARYLEERRILLQAWADWLDQVDAEGRQGAAVPAHRLLA